MKNLRKTICAGLALLLVVLTVCGCGGKKYNVFSELADITEDAILPRNVTYCQTLDAFMQERKLTQDSVTGYRDRYVISEYSAEHIPYDIRERLSFVSEENEEYKNELYQAEYVIVVGASEAEATFADLYEQAKKVMPEPSAAPWNNTLENIKNGETVMWTDKSGNTLIFSTAPVGATADEEAKIVIQITMRCGLYPTHLGLAETN